MGNRDRLRGGAVFAVAAASGLRSWRNYRALPELAEGQAAGAGHVAVIIPARNEARRLPTLLASLGRLDYTDLEVLVVDDGSDDGTGDLAREAGARVLRVEGPEPGWTGKSYACWVGARATSGEWILFCDADTVHEPGSLRSALAMALDAKAGLLSLLARQRCRTFWERLLLPYLYCLYFAGATGANCSPAAAIANGQYMLFRRDAYERIGGHEAVKGSLIEDVSLARRAALLEVRVVLARGERFISVRMYEDLRSLWEGFGKNAVRFVTISPRTGAPTVLAGLAFGSSPIEASRPRGALARVALLGAPAVSLIPWERSFGVPPGYALLYPLAAAAFQLITLDSIRRLLLRRGTVWKGRRY